MLIKSIIDKLTLREKIGQTAVIGQKSLIQVYDMNEFFKTQPYGGVWSQGVKHQSFNNILDEVGDNAGIEYSRRYGMWIKGINENLKVPLFSTLDAERRVSGSCLGASDTTSATGIGAAHSEKLAYEIGSCVASELLAAGNNWIWGPVADNPSPFCAVSLTRTYSNDVDLCCKLVVAQIKGIQSEGVAATAKHFPGADKDEYRDAHVTASELNQSVEEWYERQGRIFQAAIDAGVYSVMVGHISFKAIDEAGKTDITDKTDKATKEDKPDNDKVVKLCSEDYKAWFKEISKHLKINPIIAMDAEKGAKDIFDDMTMTAGAPALGAAASEKLAYKIGECIAAEIKHAGVSWLWSPVVDLSSRFNSVNIGRVFSDSAELQKKLACAQIKGIQSKSVAAGVKHFPGTDLEEYRDPHITQTVISSSLDEWERSQGMIFQAAVDADAWSVMVGHLAFPAVDDTKINGAYIPATLSHKIITGLLKNKMGFKGVVLTDSVVMAGLSTFYPREKLYVELLKAGNDALIGLAKPDYVDIVEKAVLSGELSEERINDACLKMLRLKEKTGVLTSNTDSNSEAESKDRLIFNTHNVNRGIAENALTLVCDHKKRLPFRKDEVKRVAIICSTHYDEFADNLQFMKNEFEKRGASVSIQRRLKSSEECEQIANENDLIIYAAYLGAHKPMGASSFYGAECLTFMFALTHGKEKSIGISFGSPYIYYDFFTNADMFINAYHYNEEMQKAAVAAIYGEIPFKGVSPFKLMLRSL